MTRKGYFFASVLFLLIIALSSFLPLAAQTWQSLGPEGGNAVDLVRDSRNSRLIYAVLAPGGVYKSADGGINWIFAGQGVPTDITVGGLSIDPANSSVLYLAAGNLYKSTDAGSHWTLLSEPPLEESFHQIAVSPHNSSVLIALTEESVFRSVNAGADWALGYSAGFLGFDYAVSDVAFDPLQAGMAYLAVKRHGLLKTTDNGDSWTQISSTIHPLDLVFDPAVPSILYAVDPRIGIYRTSSGGTDWTLWNSNMDLNNNSLTCFAPGPAGSGYYYAGTEHGFFRCTYDDGQYWGFNLVSDDMPATRALLVDPANKAVVLAATSPLGIFRSTDAGSHWNRSSDGLAGAAYLDARALAVSPSSPSTIVLGTSSGIFLSSNRGATWTFASTNWITNQVCRTVAAHPMNASIFMAGTNYGIYKSSDGGRNWFFVYPTPNAFDIGTCSIIFDPFHPDSTIYAGGTSFWPSLYKSVDGGSSWTFEPYSDSTNPPIRVLAADPSQPNVIYAGLDNWIDSDGGPRYYLAKSTNGGASWTGLASDLINYPVNSVAVDPADSSRLYVAGPFGFFKSEDGGATWRRIQGLLGSGEIFCLTIDPGNSFTLYTATQKKVFRSTDAGETWSAFGTGLPDDDYITLAVDPSDSTIVYAGSSGKGGLFRTGNAEPAPILRVDNDVLNFGVADGASAAQEIRVFNGGAGVLHWTATPSLVMGALVNVSPSSGTGNGTVRVTVNPTIVPEGIHTIDLKFEDPNAAESPRHVRVTLNKYGGGPLGSPQPPFGSFDTPLDGSSVRSSIAVTGWALDDIEVGSVKIYRDPVGGETGSRVYLGDATFVAGARPDIETIYIDYPFQQRAGWGYMLLTNFLPNGGNGEFTLRAYATDKEGNEVLLGSRRITCDNAAAVLPFGAIDTPAQGGTASGSAYVNFGWALTPPPATIPVDGMTINVWVDGLPLGHPIYNNYREDIATLFPGYVNSNGAVGYFYLDTTTYADGVHTISWSVQDSAGNVDGIGSRYFSIMKAGTSASRVFTLDDTTSGTSPSGSFTKLDDLSSFRYVTARPIYSRIGFDLSRLPDLLLPTASSDALKLGEEPLFIVSELERVEILLDEKSLAADEKYHTASREGLAFGRLKALSSGRTDACRWEGYLVVGEELRPLPIGSTLDASTGIFSWLPGPGFLGDYKLIFVNRTDKTKRFALVRIRAE